MASYAAGVMCSGWFSHFYCFFGSEMSYAIYSGRTAGRESARSDYPVVGRCGRWHKVRPLRTMRV